MGWLVWASDRTFLTSPQTVELSMKIDGDGEAVGVKTVSMVGDGVGSSVGVGVGVGVIFWLSIV